jgi:glycosyltransferase involved in cell wall biosynthesis
MNPLPSQVPRFSLVIPAHNEAAYLPDLLISVEKARNRYVGGRDEIEMIVVDNASTDSTADLARAKGCRVIQEDKRIIAAVRNTGAQSVVGQIFVFTVGNRFNPL